MSSLTKKYPCYSKLINFPLIIITILGLTLMHNGLTQTAQTRPKLDQEPNPYISGTPSMQ
jgi:hypothetical protein